MSARNGSAKWLNLNSSATTLIFFVVVTIFCIVQSVFGMGLLVFGTPTLIILDVPFRDCLLFLLPASLTISLLQIGSIGNFRQCGLGDQIPLLSCAVFFGFLVHILPIGPVRLEGPLGAVMLCYGIARMSARAGTEVAQFVRHRLLGMTAAMGVLHGATNMGGAILAIIASARFSDKNALQSFVAANYAVLASSQLIVLFIAMKQFHIASAITSATIALVVFTLLGWRVFRAINSNVFATLFTGFIFAYSIALLWQYAQNT